MGLKIVVLAAGQGTRMKSSLPKVLHPLAGKPMLAHVIDAARALSPTSIIVVCGHQKQAIQQAFANQALEFVEQVPQQGTADAVLKALPKINTNEKVLILYGDVPLISTETLNQLVEKTKDGLGIITLTMGNPFGLGRIVRDNNGNVLKVVEQKDATEQEQKICEINTGIYLVPGHLLHKWVPQIQNKNKQNEFYLTDIVEMAAKEGINIFTLAPLHIEDILGVNDQAQLAQVERAYQYKMANALMAKGVTLADPGRLDVRGKLDVQSEVFIDINAIFEGQVTLKKGCHIGPNCILKNATLGENVTVLANCYLEDVTIDDNATVGPFARLRPGTKLGQSVRVGNFVEIKNATIGNHSKINHLSYVGDATIGNDVNIGAGTITCNYDGANKHHTIIEDEVFIGSDTQLIAPIRVGKGATIGAGSTVNKDVPENQLTLTHQLNQRSKKWARPKKSTTPNNKQENP
ncbi:MAG: bifunctional UDP-N-acetylglucosamine diphosphorylase/glucosamine-1-phosphate N-acetyltransferase GlmU [Proteobacteria bacterium]|nr:bifunctional UDP-N-acetylglucosamine diphosphorylase/glucosamine-1-phosphate N-acetyltransferase GlmU [Pseudomonadota bacterium]